ncbi:protein FAN isoform X1 [Selaginella moellendorffii]|uniref:protein FAN isoform X1 n=1 Tax=Selaginella moellendorffii TaxID=88036 RepID=UPI000D1CA9E3|nr:protein FAN isoform X1 [Selaginella moellendorffii]|eukprot:XP_024520106.1 protein FAN isoform X1 [Selaginella moellendorffii]
MWSDGSARAARRFSYLLLQDGEHYIQDWIATCKPPSAPRLRLHSSSWQQNWIKGRLRLCSKSIFFEPDAASIPILMLPLNKVSRIEQLADRPELEMKGNRGFMVEVSLLVTMKKNGVDAPYEFDKSEGTWWFILDFAPVQQFLHQAQSLLSVNSLPPPERDMILRNTAAQKEAQAHFDISRLEDYNEEILFNFPAAQVTPLVREPGRLVFTPNRLYFQPLHNLNNDTPVRSQKLSFIIAVAKRRHSLQHIGLEIFFKDVNMFTRQTSVGGFVDGGTAFFTFLSVQDRDNARDLLVDKLKGQTSSIGSLLDKGSSWLDRVTAAWQAGHISNYDYLMYLNLVAGRTRCDLAQWPVMPWVLKDYESTTLNLKDPASFRDLSKPIGALNPSRLAIFHERFQQMPCKDVSHPPFLYGTHYSAPGYVLYWLVRVAPAHMLRLQNGRFDTPDRLFFSIGESWQSVLTNHADVKELIPEFYGLPSGFLVTRNDVNLGVRQNGVPVGDVTLPPWAKDPDDFLIKNRRALECKHVSMNIQEWIDLIFGYKQQGEAALAADNVFHYLTYEGAVDLDKIEDPFERMSFEAQINEFGQAPQQLFTGPHPSRSAVETSVDFEEHRQAMVESGTGSLCAAILSRIMSKTAAFEGGATEEMRVAEAALSHTISVGIPESVKQDSGSDTEEDDILSAKIEFKREAEASTFHQSAWSSTPKTPAWLPTPHTPQLDANLFRRSKSPNFMLSPRMECREQPWTLKKLTDSQQPWRVHREPVNAVLVSDDNASESSTLYSASKDGLIKVYSLSEGFQVRATKLGNLPISSLALATSNDAYPTVLAGSYDNCVYAYSVDYGRSLGKVRVHDDSVSCLRVSNSKMVTGSWDATVKVWTLDEGRGGWVHNSGASNTPIVVAEIELTEHEAGIWSLDVDSTGVVVASGAEDGTVILWDIRSNGIPIWTSNDLAGSASSMRMSSDGHKLIVVSTSGFIYAMELRRGGSILSQKNCETPLRSCEVIGDVALAGSFSGELLFWSWDNDAATFQNLRNHSEAVTSIGVGRRHGMAASVATASEDCMIQVYSIDRSM